MVFYDREERKQSKDEQSFKGMRSVSGVMTINNGIQLKVLRGRSGIRLLVLLNLLRVLSCVLQVTVACFLEITVAIHYFSSIKCINN